jgi:hypothetical protein
LCRLRITSMVLKLLDTWYAVCLLESCQGRYHHTHRYLCSEWDSNPAFRCATLAVSFEQNMEINTNCSINLKGQVFIIIIYLLQLGLHPVAVVLTLHNYNKKHTITTKKTYNKNKYIP